MNIYLKTEDGSKRVSIMAEIAVEADHLYREFTQGSGLFKREKRTVVAVDDVAFNIERGELFGIIGPNGAGKTTTIKMLTTLLIPTKGTARILGFDVVKQSNKVRERIGLVLGGERGLYLRVNAIQYLRYFADLYDVATSDREKRIKELLEFFDLSDRAHDRIETFSRGMKQKLHLAKGLINDPEVLFLDEPTIGLDPSAAKETRELIASLVKEKRKTILLTTHYMFEADQLCQRIAVINHGKIVALDTPSALKKYVQDTAVVEFLALGLSKDHLESLKKIEGVYAVAVDVIEDKQLVRVQTSKGAELVADVRNALDSVKTYDFKVKEPTLEDAYLRLVAE